MIASAAHHAADPARPAPTLVLGLGNILLRDEGIGVRVIEALQSFTLPAGVELFDGATAGMDLLDIIADRERLIVVDAIDADVPPGTVLRLTPEDLVPRTEPCVSVHDMGLFEALLAARRLRREPRDVVVLGVRPHTIACGLELSPTMAALMPQLIQAVWNELETPSLAGSEPVNT